MSTVNCPAGKYCPSGTSATQNVCPKGYYCPANSRHPTPCPKGNYCPEGASAPTQCEAGFYCPDLASQHTPCTPGFYCPVGAFTQLICSGNTFSAAQASVCSCVSPPHGKVISTATDCIITCDPGFAPYMGQCIPSMKPGQLTYLNADGTNSATPTQNIAYTCPPCYSLKGSLCSFNGTCNPTCPNGYIVNQDFVCTQCPAGKQSRNNQCVDADAGYYASLGVEIACPPGTYSAPGSTACTRCPAGTSSAVIGASSCTPCLAGTYSASLGATSCTPCAQGTYSTSTGRTTACSTQCRTSCPARQYLTAACSAWADVGCTQCSDPSASQYVTAVCSASTNTQVAQFPSCNAGYYSVNRSSGAYNALGSGGSCSQCTNPSGSQYVTAVCGETTNTTTATKTCPAGQYAPGFSAGAYNTVGSGGTCTACTLPTGLQYVTGVCSMPSTNTTIATREACPAGQYISGFSAGSYSAVGSAGTCATCSSPSASQYTSIACSTFADTQFGAKPTCSASQYLSGFSTGTSSAAGSAGTCTACSTPSSTQYVIATCTSTTNTQFATFPTCNPGYYLNGKSSGTYQTLGSAGSCLVMPTCAAGQYVSSTGTCTPCSTPIKLTRYVTAVCTPTSDTQFSPRPTCSGYYSLTGFKAGTSSQLGSPGTCTPIVVAPSFNSIFGGY